MKMRELINLCEGANKLTSLYHATPLKRWEKIKVEGLMPSNASRLNNSAAVYLTDDIGIAENYAEMNFGENDPVQWAILRIDPLLLDQSKLAPDVDGEMDLKLDDLIARGYSRQQLRSGDFPWWVSLEETGQCVYRGHIPPEAITLFKIV